VPDDVWGEIICAVLVMDHDVAAPGVAELRTYLESRLAGFKHPRAVITVASLPRTAATGQIQHNRVRASLLGAEGRAGR
jgi:non-ribosomal peptide synthetase component E (peptide arylation enzyme)